MSLRQLDEQRVLQLSAQLLQRSDAADPALVRRMLAQAEQATLQSHGDPARTYAASILDQTIRTRPFKSRNAVVGWLCALAALRLNGLDAKPGFDPSRQLQQLVDDHIAGSLTIGAAVDIIDDALA